EHAGAAWAELAFDAEQRMAIGRHAHAPVGSVLDTGDLHRIEMLVAGAERARPGSLDARTAATRREIAGPLGGDDHPAPQDGIASELGHAVCPPARGGRPVAS